MKKRSKNLKPSERVRTVRGSWIIDSEGGFGAAYMRNRMVVCAGVVYVSKQEEYR